LHHKLLNFFCVYNHYSIKQTNLLSPYLHISHRDKKKQMHFKTLLPEKKNIYIYINLLTHTETEEPKNRKKKYFNFNLDQKKIYYCFSYWLKQRSKKKPTHIQIQPKQIKGGGGKHAPYWKVRLLAARKPKTLKLKSKKPE
jgi:hypothetical protein